MIDEENKSATMTEAPAAAVAAPAHAAPADSTPVEPEDTVFSLPLSHVTHDISDLADNEDEEDAVAAPIGAHAAEQPTAPEATPAPAHFAEPVAAAINESAAVFAAPEPAAPAFPIAPASEVAPASTPAPEPIDVSPQDDESTARVSEEPDSPDTGDSESNAETDTVSPGDTAEIDVAAVEAKLKDPSSTMSFEPLTEERIETDSTYDAGTTTQLMWGARSDVGCVRPHNEDSYLVQSPLFCVCDGMGGHAAGEVASSIAVETIAKTAPQSADAARLAAAVEAANAAVIEAALNGLGKPGMGCTATVPHRKRHARHRPRGRLSRLSAPRGHAHPRDPRPLLRGGARGRRRDHGRRGSRPPQPFGHHPCAGLGPRHVCRPLHSAYRGRRPPDPVL